MVQRGTAVLVHGGWHGAWAWELLTPRLVERGLDLVAVDLPSAGQGGGVPADVAVVRRTLDDLHATERPVVLVGHSYGGIVATVAASGRGEVGHLLYVAAFQLDVGESLLGALGGALPPWIAKDEAAGVMTVPDAAPVFYGDVEPELAAAAAGRLRPQSLVSFADPVTTAGWHDTPSTYVACTEDAAVPHAAQAQMATRSGTVVTMHSGHSPFLSRPDELADVIAATAATL
jgi:pimeloyl-ACP methyl ester carboxylesterase